MGYDLFSLPLLLLRAELYFKAKDLPNALILGMEALVEAEKFNLDPIRASASILVARVRLALGHSPNEVFLGIEFSVN